MSRPAQHEPGERETRVRTPARSGPGPEASRVGRRLVLFAAMFVFWILLTWPFSPEAAAGAQQELLAGLVAASIVAWVMRDLVTRDLWRLANPARYAWAALYLLVLAYYVAKANVDVAYRVLHPRMPIRPGIVRVRSALRSDSARTALANSITLTPGTLTVDVDDTGTFYVHWINVKSIEDEDAARHILGRLEWLIQKIFE